MLKVRDFKEITDRIEKREKTRLRIETGFSQKSLICRNTFGGTVLHIKEVPSEKLIISHMEFKKQREGLGTEVLSLLKEFAQKNNMSSLVMEDANTKPMLEFCKKHGFKAIQGEVYVKGDGEFYGNYELPLEEIS
jgi:hypothetical protein